MPTESSNRQGAARDTVTILILLPIFTITLGVAIYEAFHTHRHLPLHLWLIVVAVALIMLNFKTRSYTLRVQDRVIRLEERLRYAALLSPDLLAKSNALSLSQIIGLRFASDAELPALIERTLAENLTRKQIKENIQKWRADDVRV